MISKQVWFNSFFVRLLFSAFSTFSLLHRRVSYRPGGNRLFFTPPSQPSSCFTQYRDAREGFITRSPSGESSSKELLRVSGSFQILRSRLDSAPLHAAGWWLVPLAPLLPPSPYSRAHHRSARPLYSLHDPFDRYDPRSDNEFSYHVPAPNCEPLNVNHKLDRHSTADNF